MLPEFFPGLYKFSVLFSLLINILKCHTTDICVVLAVLHVYLERYFGFVVQTRIPSTFFAGLFIYNS
jgi:hypothetical protein